MRKRFNRVAQLALLSLAMTLGLAVMWEFGLEVSLFAAFGWEYEVGTVQTRWAHVLVIMGFAAFAVGILSISTLRLMRQLKAAERTMRQKEHKRESFVTDVAHELRTPLAVMRAHLDTMESSENVEQLCTDVNRITRIVEQVLAKSRIEALEVMAEERADLSHVCSSMAAFLAPLVIKEGRSIEVTGAERPVLINGNIFALEQAVRNLVENAIKYSARGSTITVEVSPDPSIRIIDRGRGVPPTERELIFERFRRADRRGSGSGLGLSIVRRVAEAHGGKIAVEDAPGGGAIFVMSFPQL